MSGGTAYAQSGLSELLATTHASIENKAFIAGKVNQFVKPLKGLDQSKSSSLRTIFRKTQKAFLKSYRPYSGIDELFSTGHYDCLSATALFSLILDETGFDYSIMETNYHVFLLVHTRQGDVLIESTDRYDGLITNAASIADRIESYRNQVPATSSNQGESYYQYSCSLYRAINLEELIGLIYYNKAVVAYNNANWYQSREFITKARQHYASPRCRELDMLLQAQFTITAQETALPTDNTAGRHNNR
ncbi:MAG TPA: hypothetical protein PLX35_05380 [Cyclobacteriaceae bacterium]|nr:hypothetical protein [Cyclobacteriaceae bacterium]